MAAAYRGRHSEDPPKHRQYIDGRIVWVNTYTDADLDVVDAGIRSYYGRIGSN